VDLEGVQCGLILTFSPSGFPGILTNEASQEEKTSNSNSGLQQKAVKVIPISTGSTKRTY
jgi:hypothetical protein